jgi:hypothetical protein
MSVVCKWQRFQQQSLHIKVPAATQSAYPFILPADRYSTHQRTVDGENKISSVSKKYGRFLFV